MPPTGTNSSRLTTEFELPGDSALLFPQRSTATRWYRAGTSCLLPARLHLAFERVKNLVGEGRVKIVWHSEFPLIKTKLSLGLLRFHRHQSRHRHPAIGDGDLFARRHPPQQSRKLRFGLMPIHHVLHCNSID